MTTSNHAELLRERDAADLLGVTPRFLQERRVDGLGPRYVRLSARAIRYRRADLEAYIRGRLHSSTAEYDGELSDSPKGMGRRDWVQSTAARGPQTKDPAHD